ANRRRAPPLAASPAVGTPRPLPQKSHADIPIVVAGSSRWRKKKACPIGRQAFPRILSPPFPALFYCAFSALRSSGPGFFFYPFSRSFIYFILSTLIFFLLFPSFF